MKFRYLLLTSLLAFSSTSFAMFCPKNFNSISLGDSTAQVLAQCGKPDVEVKKRSLANQPQEWSYYIKMNPNDQGTMKVTFAFVDNKITNMTSNGIGVGATTICNNQNIQLGSSTEDVEKACGKPMMVTQTNMPGADAMGTPPVDILQWTYNGSPSVTLTFEDGKLKSRK